MGKEKTCRLLGSWSAEKDHLGDCPTQIETKGERQHARERERDDLRRGERKDLHLKKRSQEKKNLKKNGGGDGGGG